MVPTRTALLLLLFLVVPHTGAVPVEVRAEAAAADMAFTASLLAFPTGGITSERLPEAVKGRISVPGSVDLELAPGVVWKIRLATPGAYAPEQSVLVTGKGTAPVMLRVWPTGEVRGRLGKDANIEELRAFVEGVPVDGRDPALRLPPLEASCAVQQREWSCAVPADLLDLRLHAPGHASEIRFDVRVPPREVVDLGQLEPVPGAAILGRVEKPEASDEERVPEVALRLAGSSESEKSLARTRVHPRRGIFQFKGISPGSYVLDGVHPRWVAASLEPVEVLPERESRLREPMVFGPPLRLSVRMTPSLDPRGLPWFLSLHGLRTVSFEERPIVRGLPLDDGTWQGTDLPPGRYRVRIADLDGSIWYSEAHDLEAHRELTVSLDWSRLEGRVLLGEEPVAAKIWFGGRSGFRRHAFESDGEGRFSGYLPRAGTWKVEVVGETVRRVIDRLEVEQAVPSLPMRAEIRLPDTRLSGRVVDPRGRGVAPSVVLLQPIDEGTPVDLVTHDDGSFALHGLPPGAVVLFAETADRRQTDDWVTVTMEEGRTTPVELVVWPSQRLEGRVVSGSGAGIAGAQVLAYPVSAPESAQANGRSDLRGRFEFYLDAGNEPVALIVMAPGFPLQVRMAPVEAFPLDIRLSGGGQGTLQVPLGDADRHLVLWHGGVTVWRPHLRTWARLHGVQPDGDEGLLRVPAMPAGEYTACRLSLAELIASADAPPPDDRCVTGFLPPGGELLLDPPAPSATSPGRYHSTSGEPGRTPPPE